MAKDNYVIRERYTGLEEVDGQVIPVRGSVKPEELVATEPDNDEAHNNGGGSDKPRQRRRRNAVEGEE